MHQRAIGTRSNCSLAGALIFRLAWEGDGTSGAWRATVDEDGQYCFAVAV
jgi:hypothetical protein